MTHRFPSAIRHHPSRERETLHIHTASPPKPTAATTFTHSGNRCPWDKHIDPREQHDACELRQAHEPEDESSDPQRNDLSLPPCRSSGVSRPCMAHHRPPPRLRSWQVVSARCGLASLPPSPKQEPRALAGICSPLVYRPSMRSVLVRSPRPPGSLVPACSTTARVPASA